MKKFYCLLMAFLFLSVISMSGCGGGHSISVPDDEQAQGSNYPVKQVALIRSPVLERYKSYKIFTDLTLSGIGDAQYYVANIGNEASQSVLNLGFSDELSADQSLAIVNSSTGDVVFAYNPEGSFDEWKISGNIKISGGKQLRYRSLTIDDTVEDSIMSAVSIEGTNSTEELDSYEVDDDIFIAHDIKDDDEDEYAVYYSSSVDSNYVFATLPNDADVLSSCKKTSRGVTEIGVWTGNDLSVLSDDEEAYSPRSVSESGNVFRLEREVNTFSGIVIGR